jgi:hypothetical protein
LKYFTISSDNNHYLKYSDDESDKNYMKFEELGLLKKSIIVVLKITSNSIQYILLVKKIVGD